MLKKLQFLVICLFLVSTQVYGVTYLKFWVNGVESDSIVQGDLLAWELDVSSPGNFVQVELYLDSGIRGMERGVVSAGRDPETGDHRYPKLELTRLTIPRRVYTEAHMDVVAEAVKSIYDDRKKAKGLKMIYEPKYLRFFQARFEPPS